MSDFYQTGIITTLHQLGKLSLERLEADLLRFSKVKPVALVLPALYSEFEGPAMPVILQELTKVKYLNEIVLTLDQASKEQLLRVRELMARIKVILRRVSPNVTEDVIDAGELSLNPASHRVEYAGKELSLGPTEFKLLHFFMTHPDKVYSRSRLLDRVWGTNVFIEERTVDVHIRRLRMALEPYGIANMIQTVRGAGYRFSG